ncbi:MAG: helix-turn-helix transcriptional regulator [Oscillospiraceae bacterium]|nr:helix-turn-helix transcriptional regulator [Oscillospiraceae bacterium]
MRTFDFDDDIYLTIRKNIKRYRKQIKMTAAELSELVDLSHDYIRRLESNNDKFTMSVRTLYKISIVLGVKIDDLISNVDHDNTEYHI